MDLLDLVFRAFSRYKDHTYPNARVEMHQSRTSHIVVLFTGFLAATGFQVGADPQLLPNGDFESGPTVWTESSSQGFSLILQPPMFPKTPHSGSWAVWLGGADNEISAIEQTVSVPNATTVYLKYWHWIESQDSCGSDFAAVVVNGSVTAHQYDLCVAEATGGWESYSVDLTAYAGQTIALQLNASTDESALSSLFVDDVAFDTEGSNSEIFTDGFESGSTSAWSAVVPPPSPSGLRPFR